MKISKEKIKDKLIKYKFLIIAGVPLLFFFLVMLVVSGSQMIDKDGPLTDPTPTSAVSFTKKEVNEIREEMEGNIDKRPGLLKKEVLSDGTTSYTYGSHNQNRPHMIIAKNNSEILFQRTLTNPKFPVKITDYTESYGPVKWIFKGSNFYGTAFQTYIYPSLGFAFIGNPKTGEVVEQHVFPPTKVEEYVSKYGDDIPAQP